MESLHYSWNDLPDEILLMIFKALNHADVLYSFYGLNERLTRIVRDRIFVEHLTFVRRISSDLLSDIRSDMKLKRLCSEILPLLAEKICSFDLDSCVMQEILCAAHYPNLHQLSLLNVTEQSARCLFTGKFI